MNLSVLNHVLVLTRSLRCDLDI